MDNGSSNKDRRLVPSLVRARQIMDLISSSDQRLTTSEISRKMNIPKSTAHGLCATLLEFEILQKRDDQTFKIGPHVMRWANSFIKSADVTDEFLSIWDAESDFPGATITLSVRDGKDVVYIAARNSDRYPDFFNFNIGTRLPAAFTATGKAFLMRMTDHEIRRLYADDFPAPRTAFSVKNIDDLLDEIRHFRSLGYSIDNEQVKEGMRCFGKIVLNSQNAPIAGVAVSVPSEPLEQEEEENIVRSLSSIAVKISRRMGADLKSVTV